MPRPIRKWLSHEVPSWIDERSATYFITLCADPRGTNQLAHAPVAQAIFDTLRQRAASGEIYPHLALLMPDHLHALVAFGPASKSIPQTLRSFKSWIAKTSHVRWQRGFFEHRLRSRESQAEKFEYIRQNPVRAGLIAEAEDWPYRLCAADLEAPPTGTDDRADRPYPPATGRDDRPGRPPTAVPGRDDRPGRPSTTRSPARNLPASPFPATDSPFRPLEIPHVFTPEALRETLDGGQAFRWNYDAGDDCWRGIWGTHVARIRVLPNGGLAFSTPVSERASATATATALRAYLGGGVDWSQLADELPWRSDAHLRRCMEAFPALRLLQQPFGETLLAFLCSATKQIPQIKIMCENLAAALGSEIAPGVRALPDWIQVASASEADLRALGLGFRAKNIKRTADILASEPGLLARIEAAPYAEAKRLLVELPGVGEKIADCALLFGAGKLEAFPVDTWILKALERHYGLDGWSLAQLAQFGRAHFGPAAGYAQQFLFAWERRIGKRAIEP